MHIQLEQAKCTYELAKTECTYELGKTVGMSSWMEVSMR